MAKIRVGELEYDAWTKELDTMHVTLTTWYTFAVGFIGERRQLLQAKESIDKLKMLTEFLIELKPKVFPKQ